MKLIKILLVDDEENLLEASRLYLEKFSTHYQIQTANSAQKALEIIESVPFDVVISDYQMPVMDGLEFLSKLRDSGNTSSFIIFTGKGREEVAIQALNLGADFYLQKGGDAVSQFRELTNLIDNLVEKKRTELARQKLFEQQISVNELALTLGETRDLNSVYKTIFQHIYSIMDADTFVVDFYNKDEASISPGYALIAGNTLDITEFPSIPLSSKECGNQAKVIEMNEVVYISNFYQKNPIDTSTDKNQANYFTDRMFTQSAVYVPMNIGGDTIGVLQLQSYRLDAYTRDDINLLSTLANVAAVSIQNARFFDSQQQMTKVIIDERNIAQSYLDVVDSIVIVMDLNGKIQLINKQGCIKLQYEEQEIIGKNWFENFLPENSREQVFESFSLLIKAERESFSVYENTILPKDKQERLISWRTKVLKDEFGAVTGVLSSGQDLTRDSISKETLQDDDHHLDEVSFLASSALEFIGLTSDRSIYQHIGEKMSSLIKDAVIVASSYNSATESFLIESVQGLDFAYFDKIFNKKLVGSEISVEPRVTTFVSNNTITKIPTSLYDMSNGFITQKEEAMAKKLLNITDYYIISFIKEGRLLGSVIVILRNNAKIENIELIDAFSSQASNALLRSEVEEDLKESETKYRSLFDFSNDGIILYVISKI
ncbi:MAG: response regulator [Candidatus Heimdallarchaeota archaeon]